MAPWRRAALAALLLLLGLAARSQARMALNLTSFAEELEELDSGDDERCMSIAQLKDAVELAAYRTVDHTGQERKVVMLTSCDMHCLELLFPVYIRNLENTRDGDISSRLIVASTGIASYLYCDALRAKHKHRCVLDRFCFPLDQKKAINTAHGGMSFGKPSYMFALLLKVKWAQEILKLGYSVLWTDLDITYFGDPLKTLLLYPDADFMISAEYWDDGTVFPGPAKKFEPKKALSQNGGLWLAHPSGKPLIDVWVAQMHRKLIVEGKVYTGGSLDQYEWGDIVWNNVTQAPIYSFQPTGVDEQGNYTFTQIGNATRTGNEVIYRLSAQWFMNQCFSPCGYYAPNKGFDFREVRDPATGTLRFECIMPKSSWDRLVVLHHNCMGPVNEKRDRMVRLTNATYDEAAWNASRRRVMPRDEPGAWYTRLGGVPTMDTCTPGGPRCSTAASTPPPA